MPIVLTLVTESGGNEVLLEEVTQELKNLEQQLGINIVLKDVDRFGEGEISIMIVIAIKCVMVCCTVAHGANLFSIMFDINRTRSINNMLIHH